MLVYFFFFNDTATTEIYTLSLHDALPILMARYPVTAGSANSSNAASTKARASTTAAGRDRKSTRLNSSHDQISYAVFCLKKKKIRESKRYSEPSPHHRRAWSHRIRRL